MLRKKSITYASLSLLWLVNPVITVGCDQNYGPAFGEAEMLDLMTDINGKEWTFEDNNRSYIISFNLNQQSVEEMASILSIMGSAHACGTRSFIASASACIETTELPMEGTVSITDAVTDEVIVDELSIQGEMMVFGYELDNASVSLNAETADFWLDLSGDSFVLSDAQWE